MTECPSVLHLLYPYLDREVGPAERDKTNAHLAGCATCRESYAVEGRFLIFLQSQLATSHVSRYSVPRVVNGMQLRLPFSESDMQG